MPEMEKGSRCFPMAFTLEQKTFGEVLKAGSLTGSEELKAVRADARRAALDSVGHHHPLSSRRRPRERWSHLRDRSSLSHTCNTGVWSLQ